ncbi:MAG: PKD domain-containing protein, partial [Saprospiraceae bacterium]|nr:PKD domain-containing protein [Saprospiraceae bacterium]
MYRLCLWLLPLVGIITYGSFNFFESNPSNFLEQTPDQVHNCSHTHHHNCSHTHHYSTTGKQDIYSPQTNSSGTHFCAYDEWFQLVTAQHPDLIQKQDSLDNILSDLIKRGKFSPLKSTYTVPVVVHVVHNGGTGNIPNTQVLDAIQHLNDAFENIGVYNPATGVDVDIEFCLAQQDPNGNATTGITNTVSTLTNLDMNTQDLSLKNLVRWTPTDYVNIWVVNEICSGGNCGVAGYAYLPSAHGSNVDGIVMEASFMGSSTDNSKVLVHEMGHYFGLYHPFQNGCTNNDCTTDGDRVCDTPPDGTTAYTPCTAPSNSCTTDENDLSVNNPFRPVANGGLGDQPDQIQNYMDYSQLICYDRFTQGQKDRMHFFLTNTRASLLNSNACSSPCLSPININFNASAISVTSGTNVTFTNTTTGTGTLSYNWFIDGVSFATTTNSAYTFNTPGVYSIMLEADNGDPNCLVTESIDITVTCPIQSSFTASQLIAPQNNTIAFQSQSTGTITTYEWLVNGLTQGTNAVLNHLFTTPGLYTVELVVGNGLCTDTSALEVTITSTNIDNYNPVGVATNIGSITNGTCSGTSCFQLTPDISVPQAGAVWNLMPLDLTNGFDFEFCVYLGDKDANGADGICFVLQQDGINALGGGGGNLGYDGITPSIGFELDDFNNNAAFSDIANDHVSINYNGIGATAAAGPVDAIAGGGNIEDGNTHNFRITWHPRCETFQVYVDGDLRLTHTDDVVNTVFGGNSTVFWGMTAGTWTQSNLHEFCVENLAIYPFTDLGDTCVVGGLSTMLNATTPLADSYTWSDGSTNSTLSVSASGTYWVDIVTTTFCGTTHTYRDSIEVADCVGDCENAAFQKHYGGTGDETLRDIIVTQDGGFMAVGYTTSFGSGSRDGYVLKTDYDGNVQWSLAIGENRDDLFSNVLQDPDGSYVLVGYTGDATNVNRTHWMIKLSNTGTLLWAVDLGGINLNYSYIARANNGDYLVGGYDNSSNNEMIITRVDPNGNVQWFNIYDASGNVEWITDIVGLPNGEIVVSGITFSSGSGGSDGVVMKLDALGNIIWSKTLGTTQDDAFNGINVTPSGNFILTGFSRGGSLSGTLKVLAAEVDNSGNLLWSSAYGVPGESNRSLSAEVNDLGEYIVHVLDVSASNRDFKILRLGNTGNLLSAWRYGGVGNEQARSVKLLSNSSIVVAGRTQNGSIGGDDAMIVKTDTAYSSGCDESVYSPNQYPITLAVSNFSPSTTSQVRGIAITPNFTVVTNQVNPICETPCNTQTICSKKQANIWYFGVNAGLDFNSGAPTVLTDGQVNTGEGCAVLSDQNGDLVFYTDGQTVYDRTHNIMPNGTGLLGHPSSTQSGVIVPHPGDPTLFYIFTVDFSSGSNGLRYSVVDLTLNGGLGDVTATKNVLLLASSTEKIGVVKHCNQSDYWVIGHEWGSNNFYVYEVNATGLNLTPNIQAVGTVHTGAIANKLGYMKPSADGSRLACAVFRSNLFELFDFNNSTGIISNPMVLSSPTWSDTYGVEFSADGNLMYGTTLEAPAKLLQLDLSSGNAATIQASATILAQNPNRYQYGALQMGPDGKIYVARRNITATQTFLATINNPSVLGTGANFQDQAITLTPGQSNLSLPTFVQSYLSEPIQLTGPDTVCLPSGPLTYTLNTSLSSSCTLDTIIWQHLGNNTVLIQNDSTLILDVTQAGQDTIIAEITEYCGTSLDTIILTVYPEATLDLGPDTSTCENGVFAFNAGTGFASYEWQDGYNDSIYTATVSGLYHVEVVTYCGDTLRDSVNLFIDTVGLVAIPDTSICLGDTLNLSLDPTFTYQWLPNTDIDCNTCPTV